MPEKTSCYNCENGKVGENSKGISNHYKMGKCCHRELGKNKFLWIICSKITWKCSSCIQKDTDGNEEMTLWPYQKLHWGPGCILRKDKRARS